MGNTFIERLYSLECEFVEAGKRFGGLRLGLLANTSDRRITRKGWEAFIRSNGGDKPGERAWDLFPGDQYLGLFYGNGYQEFQALASKAYRLFWETDPTLDLSESYYGWLRMLGEIARNCPTPEVNYKVTDWGYDDTRKRDSQSGLPMLTGKTGDKFLPYPVRSQFKNCLFQTSASVLQMFYAPHRTTFLCDAPQHNPPVPLLRQIRLVPWQLCAVICDNFSLAEQTTEEIAKSGIREAVLTMHHLTDRLTEPAYIEGPDNIGWLMLGGRKLRKVDPKATFLRLVLRKFESRRTGYGWPPSIDIEDPELEQQARGIAKQMKLGQMGPRQIEFKSQKSGKRIAWKIVDVVAPSSQQAGGEKQDG